MDDKQLGMCIVETWEIPESLFRIQNIKSSSG